MKLTGTQLKHIQGLARAFMEDSTNWRDGKPKSVDMVQTGAQAWAIAHRCGIVEYCYGNTAKDIPEIEGVNDAHIKTALALTFPLAVFKDKYRY